MANGLLDFFGKDYEDPRTQGLLQFGLGLMQAGGYQDRPVSLGQAMGAAGQQGMQAYQAAQEQARKKEEAKQIAEQRAVDLATKKASLAEANRMSMARGALAEAEAKMGTGFGPSQDELFRLRLAANPELSTEYYKKMYLTDPSVDYKQFGGNIYKTVNGEIDFSKPEMVLPEDRRTQIIDVRQDDGSIQKQLIDTSTGGLISNIGSAYTEANRKQIIDINVGGRTQKVLFDMSTNQMKNIGDPVEDAPKDVSLVTAFDESGNEVKGYMDGTTFVQVGGAKAKSGSFVTVLDRDGGFIADIRRDSLEADQYADLGYQIVERQITGGAKDVGIQSGTAKKIELDLVDLDRAREDLLDIKDVYDPSMQTFATRSEAYILSVLEKGGVNLTAEQEKLVGDVAEYKQQAWDAANRYIKYLTGAQMSEAEARRIMKSFPDPRLGLFEGDSPSEFKRKLDAVLKNVEDTIARNQYVLRKGFTVEEDRSDAALESGDTLIFRDNKGREIDFRDMDFLRQREAKNLSSEYKKAPQNIKNNITELEYIKQGLGYYFG